MQFSITSKLEKMSVTDPLTGLINKAKLYEELRMWMNFSRRYRTPLSLVLLDIDDFKKINDQFGHLAGDRIIAEISGTIGSMVRETDIPARWGGDEFAIILPHTSRAQAVEIMERIRVRVMEQDLELNRAVTCSFGVASYTNRMEDIGDFISAADEALYKAKSSGKNIVRY